jgi:hypothetical protein
VRGLPIPQAGSGKPGRVLPNPGSGIQETSAGFANPGSGIHETSAGFANPGSGIHETRSGFANPGSGIHETRSGICKYHTRDRRNQVRRPGAIDPPPRVARSKKQQKWVLRHRSPSRPKNLRHQEEPAPQNRRLGQRHADSFFGTLTQQLVCRLKLQSRAATFEHMEGCGNGKRRRSRLGFLSPIEFEGRNQQGSCRRMENCLLHRGQVGHRA